MKISNYIRLSAALILLVTSVAAMGAAPVENGGKGPLDKTVFVHYPKHEPAKPAKPGPGGTGVLSSSYKYSGVRWGNPSVDYYVNTSGTTVGRAAEAIQASFEIWGAASSDLKFNYQGATAKEAGGTADETNVVSWADITQDYPHAIAVTFIWSYRYNKQIVEVDTIMNSGSGFVWSYTSPKETQDLSGPAVSDATRYADPDKSGDSGTYDIRNIMTHEAGHWIMLGDLYNSTDSLLTMYGYGSLGEIAKDTLGYGDELGVERAYGP